MNTHADTTEKKSFSSPNAIPDQQGIAKSIVQFTDNRPEAIAQRKLQALVDKSPRVRPLRAFQKMAHHQEKQALRLPSAPRAIAGQTGIIQQKRKSCKSQAAIQCDFRDNAIEKIHPYAEKKDENLNDDTCGPSARLIYAAISEGKKSAGSGSGVDSLTTAMSDAEGRKEQVFIFYVDADIVGHFFTILQNGKTATIMQGYLDAFTLAENIAEGGGGWQLRNTGALKADLSLLVELRDKVKDDFDISNPNEKYLLQLGPVHTRLFGPGADDAERLWIKRNIIRKKTDDLKWEASFAEGIGAALNSEAPQKKSCFLTTACTQYMGLSDDCMALRTLRSFRDGYLSYLPLGPAMILEYYRIAPEIVQGIQSRPEAEAARHWSSIYQIICSCVDAIKNEDKEYAYETYKSMVLDLKEKFIQPDQSGRKFDKINGS